MTYADDDLDDDYDEYDPDEEEDDWYDDRDDYEPDPEDADFAREYAEHWQHREDKHGGGECDCVPSALDRARWRLQAAGFWMRALPVRFRIAAHQVRTIRAGSLELTIRFRLPRQCGACRGRGWFYSKTGLDPMPMPEGYDGVSLCGCGSAITQLADTRKRLRQAMDEPPF